MAHYQRTLTYVQLHNVELAVNEQNAVVGLVIPTDDTNIARKFPRLKSPPRAFQGHMVNGRAKPIEMYFPKYQELDTIS